MKHGSHPHELHALPNMENNNAQNLTCFGCKLPLSGTCYACKACKFYLHQFCFELPQSGQFEFIHPQHKLSLVYGRPHAEGAFGCAGKDGSCDGFTYTCKLCDFSVHANNALLLHPDPRNSRDQYVAVYFVQIMREMKSLRNQLESVKERAMLKNVEMEEDLRQRRHNLAMQQMKWASDSIDFLGQIDTSSSYKYTYKY